jgi:hypothetical protein
VGLWFFISFRNFFSDNTRVSIFFYYFPEFNIRLYDKNSESDFFFPPPKSEYFFQQHWESEYFLEKKHNPPPLQVKWSFPKRKLLTFHKTLINFLTLSSIESNLPQIVIKLIGVTMTVGTKFIGRI